MPAKRASKKPEPFKPFTPQKTAYRPSDLCWEIILANHQTAVHLACWRWMWLLPQVARAFRAGIEQEKWMKSMCENTQIMIWKSKANALFALTARDMADVTCKVVSCNGRGWKRCKEAHLMRRDTVLQLALDKHGGTFRKINDVFLKRADARRMRKRPAKRRYFYIDSESDYSNYED